MPTIAPPREAQPTAVRPITAVPPGPVRLTRRGRVAITTLLLAFLFVVLVVAGGQSAATDAEGPGVPTQTVVVAKGDTLWAIAAEVAPERDIREVIHEIEKLNALPGPALVEGQELLVPTG